MDCPPYSGPKIGKLRLDGNLSGPSGGSTGQALILVDADGDGMACEAAWGDPGIPPAPQDNLLYGRRNGEWAQIVTDANSRSSLLSTNAQVFADGEQGGEDPDNLAGWYYSNSLNAKINWYFYSSVSASAPTYEEYGGVYFVVNVKATGSQLFVNVYTQPEGDGQDFAWYRSRFNFDDIAGFQALAPGRYLVHTEDLDVTGLFPELPRFVLPFDPALSNGPQQGTERLFLIALSTSSGTPAGSTQVTVENFAYATNDLITRYDLIGVDGSAVAATAGTFRGQVANSGELGGFSSPLEGDTAGVQATGTLWRYDGAAWVDTGNTAFFQNWIPPVEPPALPQNEGEVRIAGALSSNVAKQASTGQVYRTGPTTSSYNVSGMVGRESIRNAGEYFEFPSLVISGGFQGFGLASNADRNGTGPNDNGVATPGVLWDGSNSSFAGRSAMAYFTTSGPWTYGSQNGGSFTTGSGYSGPLLQSLGLFSTGATVRVGLDANYRFYVGVVDEGVVKVIYRSQNPLPNQIYRFVWVGYNFASVLSQLPDRYAAPPLAYSDTAFVRLDGADEYISFDDSSPIANVLDWDHDWSFGFKLANTWNVPGVDKKDTVIRNGQNAFYIRGANTGNSSPYVQNGLFYDGQNGRTNLSAGNRVVVTYDSANYRCQWYVNGQPIGDGGGGWNLNVGRTRDQNNADGTVTIGTGGGLSSYLAGGLDEVFFVGRMLTASEAAESAAGGDPAAWSFYTDVIDFLTMGEDVFPAIGGVKGVLDAGLENGEAEDFESY